MNSCLPDSNNLIYRINLKCTVVFEKESFWVAKRVLLVSKRSPFEGQKDNYWKAKGVHLKKVFVSPHTKKAR